MSYCYYSLDLHLTRGLDQYVSNHEFSVPIIIKNLIMKNHFRVYKQSLGMACFLLNSWTIFISNSTNCMEYIFYFSGWIKIIYFHILQFLLFSVFGMTLLTCIKVTINNTMQKTFQYNFVYLPAVIVNYDYHHFYLPRILSPYPWDLTDWIQHTTIFKKVSYYVLGEFNTCLYIFLNIKFIKA